MCWLYFAPIHIYGITQRLKGVKRNTHRQNNMKRVGLQVYSKCGKSQNKTFNEKVVIFENAQNA